MASVSHTSSSVPAVDRAARSAHDVVDRAAVATTDAVNSTRAQGRRAVAASSQFADVGLDLVRDNPLRSVGIAAAVGFVLGTLWTAR